MAIYVYSHIKSSGARDLVEGLGATRLRTFDGMDFYRKGKKVQLKDGDILICWGNLVPEIDGVRVLNAGENQNKYQDAMDLISAGINTVPVSSLPKTGYMGRSKYHVGGGDLLVPPAKPDFYVAKLDIVNEYRIHSFLGRSIRAGKKILREGFQLPGALQFGQAPNIAHPWIRSYDAGWRIFYDNFKSPKSMRGLAAKAVRALNLDFGAVDIGELASGGFIVLEVNKAPGLEGGTTESYIRNIKKWIEEKPEEVDDEVEGVNDGQMVSDVVAAASIAAQQAQTRRTTIRSTNGDWILNFDPPTVTNTTTVEPASPVPTSLQDIEHWWRNNSRVVSTGATTGTSAPAPRPNNSLRTTSNTTPRPNGDLFRRLGNLSENDPIFEAMARENARARASRIGRR